MKHSVLVLLVCLGGCTPGMIDGIRTTVGAPPVFREATPEERAEICGTETPQGAENVAEGAAAGSGLVGYLAAGASTAGAAITAMTMAPVAAALAGTSFQTAAEREAFCNGTMPRVGGAVSSATYSTPDPALCSKLGAEQAAQIGCPMM